MIIAGIILFLISFILLLPMRHKPLYCDDGNWFYFAMFKHLDMDWYVRKMAGGGFFKIQGFFRALCAMFPGKEVSKLYVIKAFWYALTVALFYALSWQLTGNPITAGITGVAFLFMFLLPDSRAAVTYGEVFLILPVIVSTMFAIAAVQTNNLWLLIVSGLFSAWAMQIKIIALVPAFLISLVVSIFMMSLIAFGAFWVGFVLLYALPILFISVRVKMIYIKETIGFFVRLIAGYCGGATCPRWLGKLVSWTVTDDHRMGADYVSGIMQITFQQQLDQMRKMVVPVLKTIPVVLLLALTEIVLGIATCDWLSIALFSSTLVLWLLIIVQKTHLPSRYLMVWAPVALLSAMGMMKVFMALDWHHPAFIALAVAVLWQIVTMVVIVARSMQKEERYRLANYNDRFNGYFAAAKPIGEYIRQHAGNDDTMLVWGNIPSLYLYAGVKIPDIRFTHIYPAGTIMKQPMMDVMMNKLHEEPPVWVVFMQGITARDDWSMQKLQAMLPVSYTAIHQVEIKVGMKVEVIPIYRRNEAVWREVSIDRWLRTGDVEHLKRIPDNELLLRYSETANRVEFLQRYDARSDLDKATISRLQGDLFKQNGQLDMAEQCYQQALMIKPDDFRSVLGLGEIAFHRGDIRMALISFQKVYELHSYSVDALNNMGVILFQLGQRDQARQCFVEALRIAPDYQEAMNNLNQLIIDN